MPPQFLAVQSIPQSSVIDLAVKALGSSGLAIVSALYRLSSMGGNMKVCFVQEWQADFTVAIVPEWQAKLKVAVVPEWQADVKVAVVPEWQASTTICIVEEWQL